MLAWVLNTPLLFKKTLQRFYFFKIFYIIRRHDKALEICYLVLYFFQFIKNAIVTFNH